MSEYNLGTASGKIEIDGKGAATGFKVAETAAGAMFDVVKYRVREVQQLGKRMGAVGAAGVSGFGLAIKTASGFETQMSGVKAVTNSTGDEFEALRQKAMKLGADTVYSASEAATAIEELAKAGIPVKDILTGAADAAVALAAAGGIGLEEAASIASNAMNQFGLSSKEVGSVADILAGVANTSASDVSGIGQSLAQAGAVANLAGLSFKDTAIAIGEMADAGIQGSDAGTSIKTMLNNLIPTTEKQRSKFEDLNLLTYDLAKANKVLAKEGLKPAKSINGVRAALSDYLDKIGMADKGTQRSIIKQNEMLQSAGAMRNMFFDQAGNIKNLAGLQGTLGKALKGLTKEQKLSTLETLFGADAMRASAILSLAGAKGYHEFAKAVDETKASDVAATRLDNLSGAVEAFKGSMETALITIGNVFLPVITKIVKGLTWLVNKFNELPNSIKVAIAIFGAIISSGMLLIGMFLAFLPVIAGFVAHMLMMMVIRNVASVFVIFYKTLRAGLGIQAASSAAMARTGVVGKMLAGRFKMLIGISKAMRVAWVALTGPIGLIALAIAAAIAVGVLLYKKWQPFHDLVDRIAATIRDKFLQAWAALKPILLNALAAVMRFGQFIKATLLPVLISVGKMLLGKLLEGWNKIKTALAGLAGPLQELVSAFKGAGTAGGGLLDKMQPFFQSVMKVGKQIAGVLVPALGALGYVLVKYVMPILIKVVGFLLGVVIDAVVGLVKGVIQAVKGFIQIFTGLIDFFTGVFTGNWSKAWDGIKKIFEGFLNLIIGAFKVWMNFGLLKVVGVGFALLRGLFKVGWRAILGIFKAAGKGIWAVVKGMFKVLWKIITAPFRLWIALVRGTWRLITNLFNNAGTKIVGGVKSFLISMLRTWWTSGKNLIDLVVRIWKFIWTKFDNALTSLVTTVRYYFAHIIDFVRDIPGKIVSALGNLGNLLYNAGKELINGLINGIKDMLPDIGGAMGAIGDKIKGFLPGSPVKEGPLVSWNNGATGKKLVDMLSSGIDRDNEALQRSVKGIATYVNGISSMIKPVVIHTQVRYDGVMKHDPVITRNLSRNHEVTPRRKAEGGGKTPINMFEINNPVPERAGQSVQKVLRNKIDEAGWNR